MDNLWGNANDHEGLRRLSISTLFETTRQKK